MLLLCVFCLGIGAFSVLILLKLSITECAVIDIESYVILYITILTVVELVNVHELFETFYRLFSP